MVNFDSHSEIVGDDAAVAVVVVVVLDAFGDVRRFALAESDFV